MNEKELAQLIQGRRTVGSFQQKEISQAWLEEALRLSLWVPNHRLTFPWKYFLLSEKNQKQVFTWACENKKVSATDDSNPLVNVMKEQFLYCKILVLGLTQNSNPEAYKEDYATLACSVEVLSLYLWQKGLGCKWGTGKVARDPHLYSLLSLSEHDVKLEGMLTIGWPKEIPQAAERPSLDHVFKTV